MAEQKLYTSGDIEDMYSELADLVNDDYELLDKYFKEYDLSDYEIAFNEVMAGGLPEDKVCTHEFCKNFCEGMQKIKEELSK